VIQPGTIAATLCRIRRAGVVSLRAGARPCLGRGSSWSDEWWVAKGVVSQASSWRSAQDVPASSGVRRDADVDWLSGFRIMRRLALLAGLLSMAVALGGMAAANAAGRNKRHRARRGCKPLPVGAREPAGPARGRVILEAKAELGGSVRLLGRTFHESGQKFVCWEHTRVTIREFPDQGLRFTGWRARDVVHRGFRCSNGSAICKVNLINHRPAQLPDHYFVAANFCDPAGPGRGPPGC
jgi:hypothetical protein